jgi:hypothetical protein
MKKDKFTIFFDKSTSVEIQPKQKKSNNKILLNKNKGKIYDNRQQKIIKPDNRFKKVLLNNYKGKKAEYYPEFPKRNSINSKKIPVSNVNPYNYLKILKPTLPGPPGKPASSNPLQLPAPSAPQVPQPRPAPQVPQPLPAPQVPQPLPAPQVPQPRPAPQLTLPVPLNPKPIQPKPTIPVYPKPTLPIRGFGNAFKKMVLKRFKKKQDCKSLFKKYNIDIATSQSFRKSVETFLKNPPEIKNQQEYGMLVSCIQDMMAQIYKCNKEREELKKRLREYYVCKLGNIASGVNYDRVINHIFPI